MQRTGSLGSFNVAVGKVTRNITGNGMRWMSEELESHAQSYEQRGDRKIPQSPNQRRERERN